MHFYLPLKQTIPNTSPYLQNNHLHWKGHHEVYIAKYNDMIKEHEDLRGLLPNKVLDKIWLELQNGDESRLDIFQNCMQALNHELFWKSLKLSCDPINDNRFNLSKECFVNAGKKCMGSGWLWITKVNDTIDIFTTQNEESPHYHRKNIKTFITKTKVTPQMKILGAFDLWEHTYYPDYPASRMNYLSDVFDYLLNYEEIDRLLKQNSCIIEELYESYNWV